MAGKQLQAAITACDHETFFSGIKISNSERQIHGWLGAHITLLIASAGWLCSVAAVQEAWNSCNLRLLFSLDRLENIEIVQIMVMFVRKCLIKKRKVKNGHVLLIVCNTVQYFSCRKVLLIIRVWLEPPPTLRVEPADAMMPSQH